MLYQQYIRAQTELGQAARIPTSFCSFRSTLLPSATEPKEMNEMEEPLGTSPPLELRRVTAQRVPVSHNLQSPQDRATGNFEEQILFHHTLNNAFNNVTDQLNFKLFIPVIPHPHYPDIGPRFYENARPAIPTAAEPPPAHRNQMSATPPINYAPPELPAHLMPKTMEQREREQREKERKSSIPGKRSFVCFSLFSFC